MAHRDALNGIAGHDNAGVKRGQNGSLAQLVRALPLQGRGHKFKSCNFHQRAHTIICRRTSPPSPTAEA